METYAPSAPGLVVEDAGPDDLPAIQVIYAHHVTKGTGSFELEAPSVETMAERFAAIRTAGLPYLVARQGGRVVGYAYAGPFRPRAAYRHTVEDSVYVAPDFQAQGAGGALLAALINRCTALGYRQMIAVIGDSANAASISLHARMGFRPIGALKSTGFKFGRWVDSVLMQRSLGEGDATLPGQA